MMSRMYAVILALILIPACGGDDAPQSSGQPDAGTSPALTTWADYAAEIPAVKRTRVASEVCADGFVDAEWTAGQHEGYLAAAQMRGFYLGLPDPERYPGPRPLFLALNGTGGTGLGAYGTYGGDQWVDDGYIVLAPDSNANGVVWPSWYSMVPPGMPDENNPDMIYIDSLLDCASAHLEIDANRLYAAGQSAGGIMTNYVLQHRPEVFAGGVAASSIFDLTSPVPALAPQPMAVIVMWGGDNDLYSGGSEQDDISVPEIDFREQAAIASAYWEGLEGGHQVHCKGADLGHSWVHGANDFVREFLTAHPKGLAQNPGWDIAMAPEVTEGACDEAAYAYAPSVVVTCGESETEGCQAVCQLLGDCLVANATVAPVLTPSLNTLGFDGAECAGCLETCATTVAAGDSAMSCMTEAAASAQCGEGITGALPAITAVNTCCPDHPDSPLCALLCGSITQVSVAITFVEAGCAAWMSDAGCSTSDDCGADEFCAFEDGMCGWNGGTGLCQARPTTGCPEGGAGACGCTAGAVGFNACELETSGVDANELGGCAIGQGDDVIVCGTTSCDRMTQYCRVDMNAEIEVSMSCGTAACIDPGPPSCACVPEDEQAHCHDDTGYPMVVIPN